MGRLTEKQREHMHENVRHLIIMESNPVHEWIVKHMPLSIVRTTLILAARGAGKAGGYFKVSKDRRSVLCAEDVLHYVICMQEERKKRRTWYGMLWKALPAVLVLIAILIFVLALLNK